MRRSHKRENRKQKKNKKKVNVIITNQYDYDYMYTTCVGFRMHVRTNGICALKCVQQIRIMFQILTLNRDFRS